MREVTWRFISLSQAKSNWALVRTSAGGDWNIFLRIICLLNAESFVKKKKNLTEYRSVKSKKPPASFIEDLFICTCISDNKGTRWRYEIPQIELLSKLQMICGPAALIVLSLDIILPLLIPLTVCSFEQINICPISNSYSLVKKNKKEKKEKENKPVSKWQYISYSNCCHSAVQRVKFEEFVSLMFYLNLWKTLKNSNLGYSHLNNEI